MPVLIATVKAVGADYLASDIGNKDAADDGPLYDAIQWIIDNKEKSVDRIEWTLRCIQYRMGQQANADRYLKVIELAQPMGKQCCDFDASLDTLLDRGGWVADDKLLSFDAPLSREPQVIDGEKQSDTARDIPVLILEHVHLRRMGRGEFTKAPTKRQIFDPRSIQISPVPLGSVKLDQLELDMLRQKIRTRWSLNDNIYHQLTYRSLDDDEIVGVYEVDDLRTGVVHHLKKRQQTMMILVMALDDLEWGFGFATKEERYKVGSPESKTVQTFPKPPNPGLDVWMEHTRLKLPESEPFNSKALRPYFSWLVIMRQLLQQAPQIAVDSRDPAAKDDARYKGFTAEDWNRAGQVIRRHLT
ncbi:MAG: hypothetical protein LQ338_005033 [Usnochroma carphineum]|nr:MAG: hypothetical protein LQ338_005033 [Usnochroma carphineum]